MPNPIHPYSVYTTEQAADVLSVSVATIQRYIRSGKLKATKIGRWYRVSGQAMIDFMSLSRDAVNTSVSRVRTVEEANYGRSFSFLSNNPEGNKYIELFDTTFQALIATMEPNQDDTENDLVLKYIATRVFNHAMIAYRCALSGYYQGSYALQRDLLEIAFLADYFRSYPEKITEWKAASNEERLKNFSPGVIYKALDNRDQFNGQKRKAVYKQYCEYASHVSFSGFKLLANDQNKIELGPFYDEAKLLSSFYDLCRNFGSVLINLSASIRSKNPNSIVLAMKHMEKFDGVFNFNLTQGEKYQKTKAKIENLLKKLEVIGRSETV